MRAGGESPGVDSITIETVASKPRKYLYPIWNRLASGSYYPQAVRQAEIPKEDGSKRLLGIPTVTNRVAQTVIKWKLEKYIYKQFSANSFGYIENKSQHDANTFTFRLLTSSPGQAELRTHGDLSSF